MCMVIPRTPLGTRSRVEPFRPSRPAAHHVSTILRTAKETHTKPTKANVQYIYI